MPCWLAEAIEQVKTVTGGRTRAVLREVAELDTVVGEYGVDLVGDRADQRFQKGHGRCDIGSVLRLGEGELGRSVDGDEEEEPALLGPDLGNVDAEVAEGISLGGLLGQLVAGDLWQAADTIALEAAMKGRAGQLR